MHRRRYAIALASLLLLATGAGCSDNKTPVAIDASEGSSAPAGTSSSTAATTPLEGKWRASISPAAAKSTLRAAGMGRLIPRVVTCPGCLPAQDFELRIAGDQLILFTGAGELVDGDETITIKGHHMVVESAEVPGQAVLGFKVDETTLRLSFISQNRPEYKPGLTEEPIIRMLYTTVPWTRVS
jgi:hypothetical protein